MLSKKIIVIVGLVSIFLSGCATVEPYDYSAFIASKPRSILVIPPMNDTVEVNAPYTFISTITRPLAEKGYYVFPVAVIDTFLKENGLPTPAEMNDVPLDKLREYIGADAVLYTHINQWGQKYQVVSSKAVVSANLKLVDAQTGNVIWAANAEAVQQSDNSGGGLAGALLGAIVDQVAGSLVDHTQGLSAQANTAAINNSKRGLLYGPYREEAYQVPQ